MAKMRPPAVPEQPVPVLGEEQLRGLFAVCAGKDFDARRDTALLMLLLDAGPRRSELLGMRLDDIDSGYGVVVVRGKGGRQRALPYGNKTAMALDRYLRARSRHRLAHLDALWLGRRGPLTASGLRDLFGRRARQAGIPVAPIPCVTSRLVSIRVPSGPVADAIGRSTSPRRSWIGQQVRPIMAAVDVAADESISRELEFRDSLGLAGSG